MDANILIKLNAGERSNDSDTRNKWNNITAVKDSKNLPFLLSLSLFLPLSSPLNFHFVHSIAASTKVNEENPYLFIF